jgi:Josephin
MYHERQRWALCAVHAMNNLLQQPKFDANDFQQICQELVIAAADEDASSSTTRTRSLVTSSWIPSSILLNRNPHCSMFFGNYDANVLLVVLERLGFQVQWQDNRQEVTRKMLEEYYDYYYHYHDGSSCQEQGARNNNLEDEQATMTTTTFGIVVNMPSSSLLSRFVTRGRHWLTLLYCQEEDDDDDDGCDDDTKGDKEQQKSMKQQWVNLDSELPEPQVIGDMDACAELLQEWRSSKHECHILLVKKKKRGERSNNNQT